MERMRATLELGTLPLAPLRCTCCPWRLLAALTAAGTCNPCTLRKVLRCAPPPTASFFGCRGTPGALAAFRVGRPRSLRRAATSPPASAAQPHRRRRAGRRRSQLAGLAARGPRTHAGAGRGWEPPWASCSRPKRPPLAIRSWPPCRGAEGDGAAEGHCCHPTPSVEVPGRCRPLTSPTSLHACVPPTPHQAAAASVKCHPSPPVLCPSQPRHSSAVGYAGTYFAVTFRHSEHLGFEGEQE